MRWLVVAALYVAALVVLGPALRLSQWQVGPENNQGAAEAMSWLDGRLDLPGGGGDVARFHGHCYNIFPLLWTLLCYAVYGLHRWIIGEPVVFWTIAYVALVAAPIPLLYLHAFRRGGASFVWSGVLAFYGLAGTCLWPVAAMCQFGWIYSIQHVLSQAGIALILIDLLGRRRFWLSGIGVMLAVWSRQPCIFYAVAVLWLAWRSPRPGRNVVLAGIPLAMTVALPMALNWAKFDSPFETGYRYIFTQSVPSEGVEEIPFRDAEGQPQILSLRYVPSHAYHMWLSPAWFSFSQDGLSVTGHGHGTALWFGTPLILLIFWDARRWWRDPTRRALMLATLPVMAAGLAWHGPIEGMPGYYRYALDFLLIWLVVLTPGAVEPPRERFTIICLTWSVFYYYMITTWSPVPPGRRHQSLVTRETVAGFEPAPPSGELPEASEAASMLDCEVVQESNRRKLPCFRTL